MSEAYFQNSFISRTKYFVIFLIFQIIIFISAGNSTKVAEINYLLTNKSDISNYLDSDSDNNYYYSNPTNENSKLISNSSSISSFQINYGSLPTKNFYLQFYNFQSPVRILNIYYNKFDNETNSIYGTGNILEDVVYKVNCVIKCNSNCCIGDLNRLKCLTIKQCNKKADKIKSFVFKIILISYFALACLTSFIIFIVCYFVSKKFFYENKPALQNAISGSLLSLSSFLIIPIIALFIYSKIKKRTIFNILGGDFSKVNSLILTTEVK